MKDGGGDVARQLGQILVGLVLGAGLPLLRLVVAECRLRHDVARDAQRIGCHLAIGIGTEVIGRDGGRVFKPVALDVDRAATGRVEVADTGGERIEAVQRLAKGFQAERLYVVLDVGVRLGRVAARESPQLRGRHAHRAAAFECVLQANHGFTPQGTGLGVERLDTGHLEHGSNLQMVLQVGTHAGRVHQHVNAALLQQLGRANAGELQQLR